MIDFIVMASAKPLQTKSMCERDATHDNVFRGSNSSTDIMCMRVSALQLANVVSLSQSTSKQQSVIDAGQRRKRESFIKLPEWHRYCRCRRFPLTSHKQAVPSKLAVSNQRPDGEKRVAKIGPFSTRNQRKVHRQNDSLSYLVLGML